MKLSRKTQEIYHSLCLSPKLIEKHYKNYLKTTFLIFCFKKIMQIVYVLRLYKSLHPPIQCSNPQTSNPAFPNFRFICVSVSTVLYLGVPLPSAQHAKTCALSDRGAVQCSAVQCSAVQCTFNATAMQYRAGQRMDIKDLVEIVILRYDH